MRQSAKVVFICIIVIVISMLIVLPAQAQPGCSNKTAKGTYGYTCNGVAPNPTNGNNVEPFAAYGVVTADGRGQWNGHGKVSFNGVVLPWAHNTRRAGPAIVNPDCTGSVTYEVTVAGGVVPDAHFEFVFVDGGNEVKGFPVDAGYAVSCQLIKQQKAFPDLLSWGNH